MPMELVELVHLHDVEILLYSLYSKEITALIQMQATITKTRRIIDSHALNLPPSPWSRLVTENLHRQKLLDGLDGIIESAQP